MNDNRVNDPFSVLLTRSQPVKPRLKTPANFWRKHHRTEIEDAVNWQAKAAGVPKNKLAPLREKVASKLYSELGEAEKQHWAQLATQEHDIAMEKWNKEVNASPSTEPADLQRYIQGLPHFIQPILDQICTLTGWKATLIAGGPEPAHGGKLNVLSIHSGTTKGDAKMNFGQSERDAYLNRVLPVFNKFLRKCYTPEECRALALPEDGLEPIAKMISETPECRVDDVPLPDSRRPGVSSTKVDDLVNLLPQPVPPLRSANVGTAPLLSKSAPTAMDVDSDEHPPTEPPLGSNTFLDHTFSGRIPGDCNHEQPSPPAAEISYDNRLTVEEPSDSDVAPVKPRRRLPLTASAFYEDEELQETRSLKRLRRSAPEIETPAMLSRSTRQTPSEQKSRPTVSDAAPPKVRRSAVIKSRASKVISKPNVAPKPRVPKSNLGLSKGSKSKSRTHQQPSSGEEWGSESGEDGELWESEKDDLEEEKVPDWFSKSLHLFQSEQLGSVWVSLLKEWKTFEAMKNYQESGRLPSKGRPAVVDMWIAQARSVTWRPSISHLEGYAGTFKAWWKDLQPEWRVVNGDLDESLVEGDWSSLMRPGLNGVHSLVAALFYWGIIAAKQDAAKKDWAAATLNVTQAFKQFCK